MRTSSNVFPSFSPLSIAVAAGGVSSEREVSLSSGLAVTEALCGLGHHAVLVDLKTRSAKPLIARRPDLVFIALHGQYGEDGAIQAELERADIPYTGSGPQASRYALDKETAKLIFRREKIPTPDHISTTRATFDDALALFASTFGYPLVIKPIGEGSSIGVTIATNEREARRGAQVAFEFGKRAMIENFVEGRELTAAVFDGTVWPVVEIKPKHGFYDYTAKYRPGNSAYDLAPEMSRTTRVAVEAACRNAYLALGCRGVARIDVMLSKNLGPKVLEVNTVPGMTPTSLAPKAASVAGLSFAELCDSIVHSAMRHFAEVKASSRRAAAMAA